MKKILLFLFIIATLFAADKKVVTTKEVCALISDYPKVKSMEDFKKILLNKAKQEALSELYGQLLYTKEDLKNGKLVSEEIRNRAVGAVRIEGTPNFFNGKGFGELCVKITAYATKKDLEMYSPKKVTLKHFCYTNPDVAIKKIQQKAKYAAFKEIVSEYNPKLKISGEQAEDYIHQFKISNPKFDFEKMSYCFDATATILPYELQLAPGKLKKSKKDENIKEQKKGKETEKAKKVNVNYPDYFDNYVWETQWGRGKLVMFFLDKKKNLMEIITTNPQITGGFTSSTILKGKIKNIKIYFKEYIYQRIYHYRWYWKNFSGIFLNNNISGVGVFYCCAGDDKNNLKFINTHKKVKDYFDEIWIGNYDTTQFKNGKIILLKKKGMKNYWADLYPTKNERGTDTYKKEENNGVISFFDIDGYKSIKGNYYKGFSFTGAMISDNKFIGAGTGSFVTKIELTKIK